MARVSEWNREDYRRDVLRAAERERILTKLRGRSQRKYRNVPKEYNGRTYQSTAEANYAADLDSRLRTGEVIDWIPQPTVRLGPARIVYRPDFLVVGASARTDYAYRCKCPDHMAIYAEYVDVKGMDTPRFKVIKDLWRAHGRLPLLIVYKDRTERIEAEK